MAASALNAGRARALRARRLLHRAPSRRCGDRCAAARGGRARACGPRRAARARGETGYPGRPPVALRRAGKPSGGSCRPVRAMQHSATGATAPAIAGRLAQLLGPQVALSQAHHNCVMTKSPGFSSVTGWHATCATGPSSSRSWCRCGPHWGGSKRTTAACSCCRHAPHGVRTRTARRAPVPARRPRGECAGPGDRDCRGARAGDVLFFHARLFHAAGRNRTADTKFSLVFTYHARTTGRCPGRARPRCPTC